MRRRLPYWAWDPVITASDNAIHRVIADKTENLYSKEIL